MFKSMGWEVDSVMDISRKINDKSVFIFKQCPTSSQSMISSPMINPPPQVRSLHLEFKFSGLDTSSTKPTTNYFKD